MHGMFFTSAISARLSPRESNEGDFRDFWRVKVFHLSTFLRSLNLGFGCLRISTVKRRQAIHWHRLSSFMLAVRISIMSGLQAVFIAELEELSKSIMPT